MVNARLFSSRVYFYYVLVLVFSAGFSILALCIQIFLFLTRRALHRGGPGCDEGRWGVAAEEPDGVGEDGFPPTITGCGGFGWMA